MIKKPNWLWNIFFFLYIVVSCSSAVAFFQTNSTAQIYYQTLISFETFFIIFYLVNAVAVVFDLLAIIPFYIFVTPKDNHPILNHFSPNFWKWFFVIRFALLFVGHSFVYKQIQSLFHNDLWVTLSVVNIIVIFYAPSYIANLIVAYKQEKQLPAQGPQVVKDEVPT